MSDRAAKDRYVFRLFVTGNTAPSERALRNLHQLCEQYLPGQAEIVVVDVLADPEAAERMRVLATPTLLRETPLPARRLIGDLSDRARAVQWLDLPADHNGHAGNGQ